MNTGICICLATTTISVIVMVYDRKNHYVFTIQIRKLQHKPCPLALQVMRCKLQFRFCYFKDVVLVVDTLFLVSTAGYGMVMLPLLITINNTNWQLHVWIHSLWPSSQSLYGSPPLEVLMISSLLRYRPAIWEQLLMSTRE